MFQFDFDYPALVYPYSIYCKPKMDATTFNTFTLAEVVYTEYYRIKTRKYSYDQYADVLWRIFRLCPEQVENFVALHETYRLPLYESSIVVDMNYLVTIDIDILYDFQPFLEMYYEDPMVELGQLVRVDENLISILLEGNWVDLSVVPYDEFFGLIDRLKDRQLTLQPRVFVNCNDPDVAGEDDPLEYYDEVLQKTAQLLTNI